MTKVHVLKSVNASEVRVLMLSKFWFWDCGFALQAARTDVRERTEQLGDAGNLSFARKLASVQGLVESVQPTQNKYNG
ncbi:uncharacterized protein LOC123909934 isoform X3 [Trifolium pratense]|uniref:uncharacterized protein LOC123909934 isoform X3 n=1 Tax=Trifolium pratense TaxID=57577 RepID=UPI0008450DEF|nr:uncharacterized protein LOC123909934 isoform X3 [Trifolium pratense]